MTDKEFVKSIYPDAFVSPEYLAGYSIYRFEQDEAVAVVRGNSEDLVWKKMREYLEKKMLRKLES